MGGRGRELMVDGRGRGLTEEKSHLGTGRIGQARFATRLVWHVRLARARVRRAITRFREPGITHPHPAPRYTAVLILRGRLHALSQIAPCALHVGPDSAGLTGAGWDRSVNGLFDGAPTSGEGDRYFRLFRYDTTVGAISPKDGDGIAGCDLR